MPLLRRLQWSPCPPPRPLSLTPCSICKTYSAPVAPCKPRYRTSSPVAADPNGGTYLHRSRAPGNRRRRSGHRHRQNFRISRTRTPVRGSRAHFNRNTHPAGPAIFQGPAASRRRPGPPRANCLAQRPYELPLSLPTRADRPRQRATLAKYDARSRRALDVRRDDRFRDCRCV